MESFAPQEMGKNATLLAGTASLASSLENTNPGKESPAFAGRRPEESEMHFLFHFSFIVIIAGEFYT